MNETQSHALDGLGVLVTRPREQGEALGRMIDAEGGQAIAFPAVEIVPTKDYADAYELLNQHWDLVLFVSTNAVEQAFELRDSAPHSQLLGAVGKATARSMAERGWLCNLLPKRQDSEGLLALPQLQQVKGWRVLIVRGEGGRPLLGDTLRQRGALVHYAEVYQRILPRANPGFLLPEWRNRVQAVVCTSSELLHNLAKLLGEPGLDLLRSTPVVVISERMLDTARELGLQRTHLATGADNHSLMQALKTLARDIADE